MNLLNFNPAEHSLFKIHTYVTAQGFIFVNFDSAPGPSITFTDQFGDVFDPMPTSATGKVIGNEYARMPPASEWEYDHTWESSSTGTEYNWKTFVDGFQECYHCASAHPTTLPKDFDLKAFYLRQGIGASRGFLPPLREDLNLSESYMTWLYPLGLIAFSDNALLIARFNAKGVLDTRYQSETYRRTTMKRPSEEHDRWIQHDIEREDVELAAAAQKGLNNGVLGKGRLHPKLGKFSFQGGRRRKVLMRDRACCDLVSGQSEEDAGGAS
jgi:hypothetical protein